MMSLGLGHAAVAQVVEHGTENAGVASSTLARGTTPFYDASMTRLSR